MQLSALTENLATVRTELKMNNEKLATIDQIRAEKAGIIIEFQQIFFYLIIFLLDIEGRLVVSQDERRVLLERSLASESKLEKLMAENAQIAKKNTESESALLEIAREYQVLQVLISNLLCLYIFFSYLDSSKYT